MAIVNGYASLPEVKYQLSDQVPENDATMERKITSVSRWIDNHCERHFFQVTEHRFFDACDSMLLKLGVFNDLHTVTEVATDDAGDGGFATVWDAADYQLLPLNRNAAPEKKPRTEIRAIGSRSWPRAARSDRSGLIRITGTWGWAEIPEDVHEACLIQSSRIFKRKDSPEGVAGWGEFGVIRMSSRLDPDVKENLKDYVHPEAHLAA